MTNEPGRHEQGSTDDVGEVKERLQREAEAARGSLQRAGENVQRQASEVTSDLQAQAQKMVSEQKEMARSGLMDMVSAIRTAADDLERHEQSQFANLARGLARGIEDFSQSIGRRNFQEMLTDVQRFARDHPATFFGGAVLAGLAIARFAKSSSEPRHEAHVGRTAGTRYPTQHFGQGNQLGDFARQARERGSGVETGNITR